MSKPGETAKADTKTDTKTPAKPEKKVGPTQEQLAAIHSGGSYVFDPVKGEFEQKRKPAEKATDNKEAK